VITILVLLFLLPRARKLGTVSFTEVAGVGWQCSIRPSHGTPTKTLRRINAWTGQAKSLGSALREALAEAKAHQTSGAGDGSNFHPKLGGREYDDAN
jgi:hypothetical protein